MVSAEEDSSMDTNEKRSFKMSVRPHQTASSSYATSITESDSSQSTQQLKRKRARTTEDEQQQMRNKKVKTTSGGGGGNMQTDTEGPKEADEPSPDKIKKNEKGKEKLRGEEEGKKSSRKKKGGAESGSGQTSAKKKAAQKWEAEDEVTFLNGVLDYSKKFNGLPKSNMVPVYEFVGSLLNKEFTTSQMYDKFRRLRAKFKDLNEKCKDNKDFHFKSPHEDRIYRLSMKMWGNVEESDEHAVAEKEEEEPNIDAVAEKEDEEPKNGRGEEEEEKKREEDGPINRSELLLENSSLMNKLKAANMRTMREFISQMHKDNIILMKEFQQKFQNDNKNMMNELKNDVRKENLKIKEDIINYVKEVVKNGTSTNNVGFSARHNISSLSLSNASASVFSLTNAQTENLEQKWRECQAVELKAASGRFELLKEECEIRLGKFSASGNNKS